MNTKNKIVDFADYEQMAQSSENWEYLCTYQLLPTALKGQHQVVLLDKMQLSYAYREGGMMHDARSPKDTVSFAVIQKCEDKACFDNMKLHVGNIVFFDDERHINFMSNAPIKVAIVSLNKSLESSIIVTVGIFSSRE